jgi:hypothetical protein
MINSAVDRDSLIKLVSETTAWQAEALRRAVSEATLQARQGRAVKLADISKTRAPVTQPSSAAAASSSAGDADFETLLGKAFAGMDGALRQTVQATRGVLRQFVDQSADLERRTTSALAGLEKIEDAFLATVIKATRSAGGPLQAPWEQLLDTMQAAAVDAVLQAVSAIEQQLTQAQTAWRDGRATDLRAAKAMADGATQLVSSVLVGLSEGLQPETAAASGQGIGDTKRDRRPAQVRGSARE